MWTMKSAHLGLAASSATDLLSHLKSIRYTRDQISDHYFASDCENRKPDFLQASESPPKN